MVLTVLLVLLGEGHLAVVLQVEPLDAAPDQILPARLHGRPQLAGVQGRDLPWRTGASQSDLRPTGSVLVLFNCPLVLP